MNSKPDEKPADSLATKVMHDFYMSLVAVSEQIHDSGPADRETLRALLMILRNIGVQVEDQAKAGNFHTSSYYSWMAGRNRLPWDGEFLLRANNGLKKLLDDHLTKLRKNKSRMLP